MSAKNRVVASTSATCMNGVIWRKLAMGAKYAPPPLGSLQVAEAVGNGVTAHADRCVDGIHAGNVDLVVRGVRHHAAHDDVGVVIRRIGPVSAFAIERTTEEDHHH